ncbi:MAG: hypothetical protein QS721_11315 [Candidatus Endonucleobacter sp. (ex Gigantidas childressi)]|nr:hypothetical protein [Candidatus Endonucleobacter sp. (ex Gigantidas childressi)]
MNFRFESARNTSDHQLDETIISLNVFLDNGKVNYCCVVGTGNSVIKRVNKDNV